MVIFPNLEGPQRRNVGKVWDEMGDGLASSNAIIRKSKGYDVSMADTISVELESTLDDRPEPEHFPVHDGHSLTNLGRVEKMRGIEA